MIILYPTLATLDVGLMISPSSISDVVSRYKGIIGHEVEDYPNKETVSLFSGFKDVRPIVAALTLFGDRSSPVRLLV